MASAYRKGYSTQPVITRLVEEWREHLDENFVVGAVLTDLYKPFDCIAHDLLIAKLAAYGFSDTALRYVYSYLSNRKQCVRINNTYSNYQKIISGVPQGSILGPYFLTHQRFLDSMSRFTILAVATHYLLLLKQF